MKYLLIGGPCHGRHMAIDIEETRIETMTPEPVTVIDGAAFPSWRFVFAAYSKRMSALDGPYYAQMHLSDDEAERRLRQLLYPAN